MRRAVFMMIVMGFLLPASIPGPVHARLGKVGLVTTGSLRDHGFNYLAWEGMQSAKKDGLVGEIAYKEPDPDRHVTAEQNLKDFLAEGGCDLLIVSGFELGNATIEAARSSPNQKIAIVDFDSSPASLPNLLGIAFQSDEAAFLAGYVAAAVTTSGAIGTFGGQKIPPVIQFMEGFEKGMLHYNRRLSKHISLKGWSTRKQAGSFTGSFEDIPAGYRMASRLYGQGADILFPVAGMTGYGAVYKAIASSKLTDQVIGVDVDFNKTLRNTPGAKGVILTSVLKKVDAAVKNAIALTDRGEFRGGLYLGTLENGGVGIPPFQGLPIWVQKLLPNIDTEIGEITRAIVEGCLPTRTGDVRNPGCR